MQKLGYILVASLIMFVACQEPEAEGNKKEEYEKAKVELAELKEKVRTLKSELEEAGELEKNDNLSLVTTFSIKPSVFTHTIDIRGTVKSRGNITITPETPAQVIEVYVKEGQRVTKGQTLVVQDAAVTRNSIEELKTSLELANTMYDKQKKLYDKNIGTEVQLLQAENNKKSLERKLATTKSQLAKTVIKAPFSGVIDNIDVRVGQNIQPGQPIIRLVSLTDMYIKANVSENYVGRFSPNQAVDILFASTGAKVEAKISAIGQVIEPKNRTFELEIKIPSASNIKPNMVAVISVSDYINENAFTIPSNIIFTDSKGVFVYQLKKSDGKDVAIRTDITLGQTSGINTEVLSGLAEGDLIIDKGIYDISNGTQVKIAK